MFRISLFGRKKSLPGLSSFGAESEKNYGAALQKIINKSACPGSDSDGTENIDHDNFFCFLEAMLRRLQGFLHTDLKLREEKEADINERIDNIRKKIDVISLALQKYQFLRKGSLDMTAKKLFDSEVKDNPNFVIFIQEYKRQLNSREDSENGKLPGEMIY